MSHKHKSNIASRTELNGTLIFQPIGRPNNEALVTEVIKICNKEGKPGAILVSAGNVLEIDANWGTDVAKAVATRITTKGACHNPSKHAEYSKAFGPAQSA